MRSDACVARMRAVRMGTDDAAATPSAALPHGQQRPGTTRFDRTGHWTRGSDSTSSTDRRMTWRTDGERETTTGNPDECERSPPRLRRRRTENFEVTCVSADVDGSCQRLISRVHTRVYVS